MSPISILLIGFAMSTDAFAAAIGKGAAMRKPVFRDALRAGIIFGVIEAITPIIGWLLGRAALQYVEAFDHWIAFGLLGALGIHMIYNGLRPDNGEDDEDPSQHHGFWKLALTGFATSIDAMAVGVGLAFLDVHIGVMAAVIGLCTLVMVTTGIMLGRVLGDMIGKRAEIATRSSRSSRSRNKRTSHVCLPRLCGSNSHRVAVGRTTDRNSWCVIRSDTVAIRRATVGRRCHCGCCRGRRWCDICETATQCCSLHIGISDHNILCARTSYRRRAGN